MIKEGRGGGGGVCVYKRKEGGIKAVCEEEQPH
jgi:hypothetical protein